MKKILVVIDMQNDFINGTLGTAEAKEIIDKVIAKIHTYPKDSIYATRDTHSADYLETTEGKYLPVTHCVEHTEGWQIHKAVEEAMPEAVILNKPNFGSLELADLLYKESEKEEIEVELIGLCTDICVVTNAS